MTGQGHAGLLDFRAMLNEKFYGSMGYRWLPWVLLSVVSSGVLASADHQLHDIKNRIRQVQKDVSETESSRQQAQDQLKKIEQAITLTMHKLHYLEQQQADLTQALGGLYQQTDQARGQLSNDQQRLALWIESRYQQEFSREWYDSPDQETDTQVYLDALSRYQAAQVSASQAHIQTLSEMTRAHERRVQELRHVTDEVQHQQARLKEQNDAKAKLISLLSQRLDSQRQSLSALQRDAARLTQLMEKLARQAEERRSHRSHHHMARPSNEPDQETKVIRDTPEPGQDGSVFARLRGQLRLPVAGELKNRFGSPRVDTGLKWTGLFIHSPSGQPVKAVANGRVVFAGWLRGFGNVLILDHGSGYMSLYGGGEGLRAHVDETVERGAVVAVTGNTGGMDESGLYFELRYQGKPFDPLTWVGRP